VPFTLVHTGKYRTADKWKTDTTKTKDNPEKPNNTKHRTKLSWFSRFLRHSAKKRGGLILQGSRAHMGLIEIRKLSSYQNWCAVKRNWLWCILMRL